MWNFLSFVLDLFVAVKDPFLGLRAPNCTAQCGEMCEEVNVVAARRTCLELCVNHVLFVSKVLL